MIRDYNHKRISVFGNTLWLCQMVMKFGRNQKKKMISETQIEICCSMTAIMRLHLNLLYYYSE